MGQIFDPMVVGNGGEMPAEEEIARTVVGKLLPLLRNALAQLNAMQSTWLINGMQEKIVAAQLANETLAGHTAADWAAWGTVLTELQTWLGTPIEGLGNKTPTQVLITRYPIQQE